MNKRIDLLESKLQSKDEHIERLVRSMDLLEMNSKKNNVIISGWTSKPGATRERRAGTTLGRKMAPATRVAENSPA